ncbi:MAG: hypothetical protein IT356_01760 [Gemmatimonadaceae bacterium]|nr:hypothetical protein [Gemmatimonadaceae bacterium]
MPDSSAIRTEPIQVRRTALVASFGPEPGPAVRGLWYVLHGQAMGAVEILHMAHALDDGTRLVIAPEALNRHYVGPAVSRDAPTGATWLTRAERAWDIADTTAYLDSLHARVRESFAGALPPVTVVGFSQGGGVAVRWVAGGNIHPERLAIWAASAPPEVDWRALVAREPQMRISYVCGTRDKYLTPKVLDAQHAILREAGVEFEAVSFDGGHRLDDDTLRRLAASRAD